MTTHHRWRSFVVSPPYFLLVTILLLWYLGRAHVELLFLCCVSPFSLELYLGRAHVELLAARVEGGRHPKGHAHARGLRRPVDQPLDLALAWGETTMGIVYNIFKKRINKLTSDRGNLWTRVDFCTWGFRGSPTPIPSLASRGGR